MLPRAPANVDVPGLQIFNNTNSFLSLVIQPKNIKEI